MSVGQPEDTRTTETGGGGPDCSSNLNPVFKCVHMSAVQPFLPCGKAHVASTNHLLHSTLAPPFLLSVSQTEWKTGWGWKRESLTSLFFFFLTKHMCVCLKISLGVPAPSCFLLTRPQQRHIPDSPECEQMPGSVGRRTVGCDSQSVCSYCLCLHVSGMRTWGSLWTLWETEVKVEENEGRSTLPVLRSPAFDKAHADGAHPGQLVNSLEALVDWLGQQCSKLLVVENLQVTAWRKTQVLVVINIITLEYRETISIFNWFPFNKLTSKYPWFILVQQLNCLKKLNVSSCL